MAIESTLTSLKIQKESNLEQTVIFISGSKGIIDAGRHSVPGKIVLRQGDGGETIRLAGESGTVDAGRNGIAGKIILRNGAGDESINLDGATGQVVQKGGIVLQGDLVVMDAAGVDQVRITGSDSPKLQVNGDIEIRGSIENDTITQLGESLSAAAIRLDDLEILVIQQLDEVLESIGIDGEIPMDLDRMNQSIQELTSSVNKAQAALQSQEALINSIEERLTSLDVVVSTLVVN